MPKRLIAFEKWTIEDVRSVLNCAMDDGEWHTPSASDINIHTNNGYSIYGRCNISMHSSYHDKEHWFNINAYSVKIWEDEYRRGMANAHLYRPIYNIQQLAEKLKLHSLTETPPEAL